MPKIHFKRQSEGMWRRDEDVDKRLVTKEEMDKEITEKQLDDWDVEWHGHSFIRGVTLSKKDD